MKHKQSIRLMFILGMLIAGCSRENSIPPTQDIPALYTAAAETVRASITKLPTAEATNLPAVVASPSAGLVTNSPGDTTATPLGAAPSGGVTPINTCDVAEFVADITIPDGTPLAPGEAFTKTWELRNDGTCTWNANYEIVYSSGAQMGAPATKTLTSGMVAPGETIRISLEMVSPAESGQYKGYWILRNDKSQYFGIGTTLGALYIDITVVTATEAAIATSTTAGETPTFTPTPAATDTPTSIPQLDETS